VLLEADEIAGGMAILRGRRAKHIHTVHRAQPGDSLQVGVVQGRMGLGLVRTAAADEVVLELTLSDDPPVAPGIDLIVALPRPKVARRVLSMAASLGVKRLVFLNALRVERSYFDSPLLEPEAVREELLLGLEQGCDTLLPEVLIRDRFKPFVEDELESLWPRPGTRLMAHPTARQSVHALTVTSRCVIAIGPEGGWIPFELRLLEAHGFETISLGPRILRVETAIPFVFGQVAAQLAARG
jgi:RsmE family RNA methyltransferase